MALKQQNRQQKRQSKQKEKKNSEIKLILVIKTTFFQIVLHLNVFSIHLKDSFCDNLDSSSNLEW